MEQMKKHRPKWKIWLKWISIVFAGIFIVCLIGVGYIYYQIKSISLDDIKERHTVTESGQGAEPSEGDSQEKAKVPSVMKGSLEKANQFANKPISTQDAMDVAAILLNSDLGLTDIYDLMNKDLDHVSVKEKQKIRDKLLKKLSKDEIEALRSITTEYGKGLLILDPDYPIELVGVYDEQERQKIIEQLRAENRLPPSLGGVSTETVTAKPEAEPVAAQEPSEPENTGDGSIDKTGGNDHTGSVPKETGDSGSAKPGNAGKDDGKKVPSTASVAKYEARILDLQAYAEGVVAGLVQEAKQALASTEQKDTMSVYTKLIGKVGAAEAECDGKFEAILAEYKKDKGYDSKKAEAWRKQYNAAKQQSKTSALKELQSAMKS